MTGDDPDPLIGSKIGPCQIERRIAAGGMGVVYRANHITHNREVAVKILSPALAVDQEYVARFFREASAAGQIDHPNVVRVIDSGNHEGKYFLIMDFVRGESLDKVMERDGRLNMERATMITKAVASGLQAAHNQRIIHRDIKPANIIIAPDGVPHLTDFGLARHDNTRKGLTVEGTFIGTPEYASPEQVEGRPLDTRTDLYSLGVTYYHMLAGILPFLGDSPMEVAYKRTKEMARPLEHAVPGVDPRAASVCRKLLEKNPVKRYATAAELLKDLDAILTGQKVAASPSTKVERSPILTVESKRRIRALIHWDLMATAVALAFCSGALTPRAGLEGAGAFLGAWMGSDAEARIRFIFMGAAGLASLGAILIYRRELVYSRRFWALLLLVPLMLLFGLVAGILLERPEASSPAGAISGAAAALSRRAGEPVNLLALGALFLFCTAVVCYQGEGGTLRITGCRLAVLAAYALMYVFAAGGFVLSPAFGHFFQEPGFTLPMATGTLLACAFGFVLLTGHEYEVFGRTCGLVLSLLGSAGLYGFVVLASQPGRGGWADLLAVPFEGLGARFLASGTLLLPLTALGFVVQGVVAAGIRSQDAHFRRK